MLVGQYFAFFRPDANGRVNLRTGKVVQQIGDRHRLEFDGKINFSNVFSPQQLESFAFFKKESDLQAFIEDLMSQQKLTAAASPTGSQPGSPLPAPPEGSVSEAM